MVSTIRYVTGFPVMQTPDTTSLSLFKSRYGLKEEEPLLDLYSGELDNADFIMLGNLFVSQEFWNVKDKEGFLTLLNLGRANGLLLHNDLHPENKINLRDISPALNRELEKAVLEYGVPKSANDAQILFSQYLPRNEGKLKTISYIHHQNGSGNLHNADDVKTLIFIDDLLRGDVVLGKYHPTSKPYEHEPGNRDIIIDLDGRKVQDKIEGYVGYENWLSWKADTRIRQELLGEKKEGINFHHF